MDSNLNQRIALGIEYQGTAYRGWQTQQEGVITVQQTIENALAQIANHPILLHAAGRTDAGVHAANMIAHFDSQVQRDMRAWIMGTNSLLPHDISITWAQAMSNDFHARFSAIARRYRYVIYNQPYRSALVGQQATHVYYPLNLQKMQLAAQKLVGEHDFTSFRAIGCQSNQPIRHVQHAELQQIGHYIILDIQANGFLHHMVRNIIGVLLTIGKEEQPVSWIDDLFVVRDRSQASMTAPPTGLYFINALYPEQFSLPSIALGPSWLNVP